MSEQTRAAGAARSIDLDDVPPERSLGQLVSDATHDLSDLIRHEVALAKAELRADVINGAVGGGLFAAAGYLGFLASILLVIAAAYGVSTVLPAWAAFLVVAGGLLLLAGVLAVVAKGRMARVGPPERTIRSTKETLAAVRPGNGGR